MKRKTVRNRFVMALLFLSAFFSVTAQGINSLPIFREIPAMDLPVTYNKTTNLVFPFNIKSVDRGSKFLLAQKAKGVENVLQVKSAQNSIPETNLSVITGDGRLYSFRVVYAEYPPVLNLSFLPDSIAPFTAWPDRVPAQLSGAPASDETLQADAESAKHAPTFLNKKTEANKVAAALKSIYVKDKVMWFALEVSNHSLLDYQPSFIRFFLKDKKKAKRTTQQETELQPVFSEKEIIVEGKTSRTIEIGFPQFTIPAEQRLIIQLGEKNSSRLLELTIKGSAVLKTRLLQP
ncbi:conjugative transposon TraN protein [Filimonas zeae]|nr:conjugative transposon protein TraN [Filimonas zeae]MDR6339918.1 conjugative transposon TraN protein [Filimonas zeae]